MLDSTSLPSSSATDDDLEEARQRLLVHQEENGRPEYTAPLPQRQPCDNQTRYGSVSTLQSTTQAKRAPTNKRFRLPFFIILVFDWGLVIFLSIICSVVSSSSIQSCLVSPQAPGYASPLYIFVCKLVSHPRPQTICSW